MILKKWKNENVYVKSRKYMYHYKNAAKPKLSSCVSGLLARKIQDIQVTEMYNTEQSLPSPLKVYYFNFRQAVLNKLLGLTSDRAINGSQYDSSIAPDFERGTRKYTIVSME